MAVLHLIDDETLSRCPAVGAHLCDVMASAAANPATKPPTPPRVLILGRGHDAEALGLRSFDAVPIPGRPSLFAKRPLKRWAKQAGPIEQIINWSSRAAHFAGAIAPAAKQQHSDHVPVAIDEARLRQAHRAELRERFEIEPHEKIVWLLGDRTRSGNALVALEVVGLAAEAGLPVRLLTSPEAQRLNTALHIVETMRCPGRLIVSDLAARPWLAAAMADAAISVAPHPHADRLCTAWATAAGLPVVRAPHRDDRRAGAKALLSLANEPV